LLQLILHRKVPLLLAVCVPALAVGLFTYLGPRAYYGDLSYNIELTATDFQRLSNRFYGGDNLGTLFRNLEKRGAKDLLVLLREAETEQDLRDMIDLRVTPTYVDFNSRTNLKLSLDRSWAENVEKIEKLRARILKVHVEGSGAGPEELRMALAAVREDLEQHLPLHDILDNLTARRYQLNTTLVRLRQLRVDREEELQRVSASYARMRALAADMPSGGKGEVTLELKDLDKETEFLPLSVQLGVFAARTALLEEQLAGNKRLFALKTVEADLLAFISEETQRLIKEDGDVAAFRAMVRAAGSDRDAQEVDLLDGLDRLAENHALSRQALVAMPRIVPLPRHTVKRTLMTAVICGALALLALAAHAAVSPPEAD